MSDTEASLKKEIDRLWCVIESIQATAPQRRGPEWVPLNRAAFYVSVYPMLVPIARKYGYALAVHGTLNKDLDLLAVPWVENPKPHLDMLKAMKRLIGAVTVADTHDQYFPDLSPTTKPHGRLAYSLHFSNSGSEGPYIDISVMPTIPEPQSSTAVTRTEN